MSTDRILIHASIAPRFLTALKSALSTPPSPSSAPPTIVTTSSQSRVQALIASSLSAGSKVLVDSTPNLGVNAKEKGIFITPTILTDVKEDMPVWQEEAFAPLAACMIINSDEEAVQVANRSGYGLSASVFTEDLRKGFRLARELESG